MPISSQPSPRLSSELSVPYRRSVRIRERSSSSPRSKDVLRASEKIKLTKAHDELHHPSSTRITKPNHSIEETKPIKRESSEPPPSEHKDNSPVSSPPPRSSFSRAKH